MGYLKYIFVLTLLLVFLSNPIFSSECEINYNFEERFNTNPNFEFNTSCISNCSISISRNNINNESSTLIFQSDYENKTNYNINLLNHSNFEDSNYRLEIMCDFERSSEIIEHYFEIDRTPPKVDVDISYEEEDEVFVLENHQDYREIKISFYTDKDSKCYLNNSLISNEDYISHELIDVLSAGEYNYTIDCIDNFGNENDFSIFFKVLKRPYINISFEDSMPFNDGIYELEVTSSRDLKKSPTLEYSYDQRNFDTIALNGRNNKWQGYIQIEDTNSERVGSFRVRMEDVYGIYGDLIDKNKLFIVDTKDPPSIDDIKAESTSSGVNVQWYYPHKFNHFKIYRSLDGVPTKLDFYDYTDNFFYLDNNVTSNQTYYYLVTPVDDAGNEGEFSGLVESEGLIKEDLLSDETFDLLNQVENNYKSLENQIDSSIRLYNDLKSKPHFRKILEDHLYFEKLIDVLSEVKEKQDKIESLRSGKYNDTETYNLITDLSKEIKDFNNNIFIDLSVFDSFESNPTIHESDLMPYLYDFINRMRINNESLENKYINDLIEFNQFSDLSREVILVEIEFNDGSKNLYSYVNEKINFKQSLDKEINFIFKPEEYLVRSDIASKDCKISTFNECSFNPRFAEIQYSFLTREDNVGDISEGIFWFVSPSLEYFDEELSLTESLSLSSSTKDSYSDEQDSEDNIPIDREGIEESEDLNKSDSLLGRGRSFISRHSSSLSGYFVFENFSGTNSLLIIIGSLILITLLSYYLYLEFSDRKSKDEFTKSFLDDDYKSSFKPPKFDSGEVNKKGSERKRSSNYDEIANLLRKTNDVLDEIENK